MSPYFHPDKVRLLENIPIQELTKLKTHAKDPFLHSFFLKKSQVKKEFAWPTQILDSFNEHLLIKMQKNYITDANFIFG